MRVNKWVLYIVFITVVSIPFVTYRLVWLSNSIRTLAVVVATEDIRLKGFDQKQPIFQYVAGEDVINVGGNYNLPYYQGDLVFIRYNSKEKSNFKIDTTWEKWKDLVYWGSPFFLIVTMIFLAKDIIPRQVTI